MNRKIIKTLENHNIKPTPMRMLVLEQLMANNRSLTLSDIEEKLYPADRVTIYRTLKTFQTKGLVHIIEVANKGVHYAVCKDGCFENNHTHNHAHFECLKCGKVICSYEYSIDIKIPENNNQHVVENVEVKLTGICSDCLKKTDDI